MKTVSPVLAGAVLSVTLACSDAPLTSEPEFASVAAAPVTIDFTVAGDGLFDPEFFRADGFFLNAPQRCGPLGCDDWFVSFIQGDLALVGETDQWGPIKGKFTRPISELSLRVAPALQGTAKYVLRVFTSDGALLARSVMTVTQDSGDPADGGMGYFTMRLRNLPSTARRFKLHNVFVRSSFPLNTSIPFGVSSITYTFGPR